MEGTVTFEINEDGEADGDNLSVISESDDGMQEDEPLQKRADPIPDSLKRIF